MIIMGKSKMLYILLNFVNILNIYHISQINIYHIINHSFYANVELKETAFDELGRRIFLTSYS